MYDKVYRWDVLQEAWRRVKANKGASGIDHQTLTDIEKIGVDAFLIRVSARIKRRQIPATASAQTLHSEERWQDAAIRDTNSTGQSNTNGSEDGD
ncbi:hypothetical protein [Thermincola ferriacetica]|uniref:hypothetical protein n=1 Tax=Thermincola ferriacetica TaxID=281456 RepID=UPI001FA72F83|nr:hypothetical protein [Thermincola ferriacetica]